MCGDSEVEQEGAPEPYARASARPTVGRCNLQDAEGGQRSDDLRQDCDGY